MTQVNRCTFIGLVEAGEPPIHQAIDAMRQYHEAEAAGQPQEEVERLRLLAESLFQAVSDYQLRVVDKARGKDLPRLH
ncbi:hypothetical protein G1E_32385 [Pseudomonas sp. TJI-51]|nr:hypothetical protein G1E_32385 [Pseudomonas sp. TJI-51]